MFYIIKGSLLTEIENQDAFIMPQGGDCLRFGLLVPNVGAGLAPALFRAGSAKGNRGLWETRAGASPAPTDGRFGHFLPKTENLKQSRDICVVKKATNHQVSSKRECLIMLIEPKTTEHTGKIKSLVTKSVEEQKY
jgi:hypothetical protein